MNQISPQSESVDDKLARILERGNGGLRPSRRRYWVTAAILIVVAVFAVYWLLVGPGQEAQTEYRTEQAWRGDLTVTVSATGNLQPTNQVDVGSELSGTVESVFVDVNDKVARGQVLAQLDTSRLKDDLAVARGVLSGAKADVEAATATVTESSLNMQRLERMRDLSGGELPSQADIDTARAVLARAIATEARARAAVAQAQANIDATETNLSKAVIRSPIDGVVLVRNIEPGQTVAAALQAPVLFTLAEDLTRMELAVDVDEADVAQVQAGQAVRFTVDAWPQREFEAHVTRVDIGSQIKEGVVSYRTVLAVDNNDLSLRPGMTATASILVMQLNDVLLVPAAALRFTPPQAQTADSRSLLARITPRHPGGRAPRAASSDANSRQVWILHDGVPAAVPVTAGASDGRVTQITGGGLEAGMAVIIESSVSQ